MTTSAPWTYFADRLAPARSYWLATSGADGAPHVAPIWGLLLDGRFYFYSERHTVKARNIVHDPRVVVHLESADDVVIVHGRADDLGHPVGHPGVVDGLSGKYSGLEDPQDLPSGNPAFDVIWALAPEYALSWDLADYVGSQRRWRVADPV
jgi:Pyridoxamine 5'-phosphate oxidase